MKTSGKIALCAFVFSAAFSGCLSHEWFEGDISNSTDQPISAHVQVSFSNGDSARTPLINTTLTMAPKDYHSFGKIFDKAGNYEILVELGNGTRKLGMTPFQRPGGADGFTIFLRPKEVEISFYVV